MAECKPFQVDLGHAARHIRADQPLSVQLARPADASLSRTLAVRPQPAEPQPGLQGHAHSPAIAPVLLALLLEEGLGCAMAAPETHISKHD